MTIPCVKLEGYGVTRSCREYTYNRNDKQAHPKLLVTGNTKLGSVLEVLVTKHLGRYGIETVFDATEEDGSQSWVVMGRSVEKYVTELALDRPQPRHHAEVFTSTRRLVAPSCRDNNGYMLSKMVTRILLHCDKLREVDSRMGKAAVPVKSRRSSHGCQQMENASFA